MSSRNEYLAEASKEYANQLTDPKNVESVRALGVLQYLTDHNIGYELAQKYMLGVVIDPLPGDEEYRDMLAIPYLTPSGVRSLKYRNMLGKKPKFNQPDAQEPRLYNSNAYFDAWDSIGLAEGELDAINVTEYLGIPCMGIPGAEVWTNKAAIWGPLFKDFQTVYIFGDGDEAGRDMAKAIVRSLRKRARKINLPEGEDVSSMILAGRANELIAMCQTIED